MATAICQTCKGKLHSTRYMKWFHVNPRSTCMRPEPVIEVEVDEGMVPMLRKANRRRNYDEQ